MKNREGNEKNMGRARNKKQRMDSNNNYKKCRSQNWKRQAKNGIYVRLKKSIHRELKVIVMSSRSFNQSKETKKKKKNYYHITIGINETFESTVF